MSGYFVSFSRKNRLPLSGKQHKNTASIEAIRVLIFLFFMKRGPVFLICGGPSRNAACHW